MFFTWITTGGSGNEGEDGGSFCAGAVSPSSRFESWFLIDSRSVFSEFARRRPSCIICMAVWYAESSSLPISRSISMWISAELSSLTCVLHLPTCLSMVSKFVWASLLNWLSAPSKFLCSSPNMSDGIFFLSTSSLRAWSFLQISGISSQRDLTLSLMVGSNVTSSPSTLTWSLEYRWNSPSPCSM